jgi:hypothetical protein
LPDSLAGGIARVSNLKNAKVVTSPSGKKVCILAYGSTIERFPYPQTVRYFLSQVVLSQAGEVDATHYLDSHTGTVFKVDHLALVRRFLLPP